MTGRQKLGWFGAAIAALVAANCFVEVNGQAPSLQPVGQRAPISVEIPPAVVQGWPANQKPEFVLVLTGQQQSYLKFCGCTERQLGGFERRYNFMTKLRERGWPVFGVDLGDLAEHKNGTPAAQTVLKYDASIRALAALQYSAVGIGELDLKLPLIEGLSNNVLQNAAAYPPLLCANLTNRNVNFPGLLSDVTYTGGKNGAPKIGVTSVVAPSVAQQVAGLNIQFDDYKGAIKEALKKMDAEKAGFRILLCQGNYELARIIAGAPNVNKQVDPTFADKFDVIFSLSDQEEPPAKQDQDVFGRTSIVRVGHRGRYIGVMGVFRGSAPSSPFDKKFQIVEMSEEYETEKGKEAENPILKILQDYAKEVQSQAFVRQIPQREHPLKSTFKGMAVA
jgi:2',3'-cyclic-nucleotide 2'-phosphodiesterase (5'-nucleotidase family)